MGVVGPEGVAGVPWDFFHLGLILVALMVFITGIVICVAVAGVCCFHWLETKGQGTGNETGPHAHNSSDNKSGSQIRDAMDNFVNEEMRREWGREVPPSYDQLFPRGTPPAYPAPPPCTQPHPVHLYI